MNLNINWREGVTLLTLLSSMFGKGKKRRVAIELLPLVTSAVDQWENGVADSLALAAQTDPALAQFRRTLDSIYQAAKSL